ncbi:MAG TPA: OmpA family protein [Bdellovibrionota bacterium]|nr:OmpA family protein [Bdellovibrionota bacterium]
MISIQLKNSALLGAVVTFMLFQGGCASTSPAVERARQTYDAAAQDPEISQNAPLALHDAKQSLDRADSLVQEGAEPEEMDHVAYIVERKIQIARNQSNQKKYEAELAGMSEGRQEIVLKSRTLEAERARKEAEEAQARAREAEKRVQEIETTSQQAKADLEKQLAELKAKETKAGTQITLREMMFEVEKADLTPGAIREIEKVAQVVQQNPSRQILIEGHTDSMGSDAYNQELSQQRARAVEQVLEQNDIPRDRITVRGYGEAFPIAPNTNSAGRQRNRRVEITILHEGKKATDVQRPSEQM